MSKITKIFGFISIMFITILLLASCGGESDNKTGESTTTIDNKVFSDNYDIKITYTIKPAAETYTYKYVHDCRIQIKAKSTAKDTCKIKLSIYDGEADAFSEEIITRYYSLNTKSNIDEKIEDVYTNELLLAWSNKMSVVNSIDTNYTKNFLNDKTISFESNGGSSCESISVNIVNSDLPIPTKTGYSFDGWYNNQNFQKKITNFNDMTDGMKLYAKWSLVNYRINYNTTSDVINSNSKTYNIETNTFYLEEPTRSGYTFKGWYTNKDFSGNATTQINKGTSGNISLYPKWEANEYDVELIFNDGITENRTIKETYDSDYTNLPTPTREGFIFEGWYSDENDYNSLASKVSIATNHALYAKWVEGTSGLIYSKTSKGWEITGCSDPDVTSIIIPSSIAGINVVSIKSTAFRGMNKVKEIVIPNTVTTIGLYAFYDCSSVEKITTPKLVSIKDYHYTETYYYYLGNMFGRSSENSDLYISQIKSPSYVSYYAYVPKTLKEVKITNESSIGDYAFYELNNIEKLEINDGITSIGTYAFYDCSNITEMLLPNSVTSIGDYAYYGCSSLTTNNIPDSVTSIGTYAFYGCSSILNISIPNNLKTISNYAFYGCKKLTEIFIPNSVTSIGNYAFAGCVGISELTIPNNCKTIGTYAFSGMNKLKEIVIPNSVTSIGLFAFDDCSSVEKITTPKLVSIKDYHYTETYYYYLGNLFGRSKENLDLYICQVTSTYVNKYSYVPKSLKEVKITNETSIGDYAFYDLSNLEEVYLTNTITKIGNKAFYNCSNITKVYFDGTIGEWNQLIANSNGNTPLSYGAKLYVKNNDEYVEV